MIIRKHYWWFNHDFNIATINIGINEGYKIKCIKITDNF